jgi:hypothetical protein
MAQTTKEKNAGASTPPRVKSPGYGIEVIDLGESLPTPPDADLWLEMGRKWVNDSPSSIRSAASAMMTGLATLQSIYLGILGFSKFIPEDAALKTKLIYTVPILSWMIALYHALKVMRTDISRVNLNSPSDLREKYVRMIEQKQYFLEVAYWFMFGGLAAAIWLVIFRLKM